MDPTQLTDDQASQLADQIAPHLPIGTHGDRVVLTRRQFAAAATGTLSAGALMALGVDEASAQAAGQVGTSSSPVDVYAAGGGTVELEGDVTSTSVTNGYEITIDGDTYEFSTQ
jgi:hypothetical protein